MLDWLQCPNPACGKVSACPERHHGRRVRCKHCGQSFTANAPTMEGASTDTRASGPPAKPSALPAEIGRFQVRAKLGAGAFGTVYRAYDPQLDREVALKVPNAGVLDNPRRVERFLREAKAAANLRHPHIVPVFDAGKDGDLYYIASAFIAGKKLSDTIGENGVEFERAARLARELGEALAYAHEQGVIHRDVKPDNILVDEHDRVHLMDFGLAARLDEEARLTTDGSVLGTPVYMAPEQAGGQQGEVQPAADQYSAGIVLYELLCGRTPFRGPPAVVIHNQVHTPPPRPTETRAGIPRDLETICLKALAKRPEDRYADCGALADDLRRWLEGDLILARRHSWIQQAATWVRARPTGAAVSVAGVLALLSVVFVVQWRAAEGARRQADDARAATEAALGGESTAKAEVERLLRAEERERGKVETALRNESAAKATSEQALQAAKAAEASERAVRAKLAPVEYARVINLAQRELTDRNSPRARALLDSCAREFRGWEWRYLDRLCRLSETAAVLEGHTDKVLSARFSPDGTQLVTTSDDRMVRVWDSVRRAESFRLTLPAPAVSASIHGTRLLTVGGDTTARLWDIPTRQVVHQLQHQAPVRFGGFSPDGKHVLTADAQNLLRAWDATTGALVYHPVRSDRPVLCAAFGPKVSNLVYVCDDQTGRTWDNDTQRPTRSPRPGGGAPAELAAAAAFRPDGTAVATGSPDGVVTIWNPSTGAPSAVLRGHRGRVTSVAYSTDGSKLLTGGADGTCRLWDATAGRPLQTARHPGPVAGGQLSPDGSRFVTASGNAVTLWETGGGSSTVSLQGPPAPLASTEISANGARVVGPDEGNQVRAWDAGSGRLDVEVAVNEPVAAVSASLDGSWLAARSGRRVRLVRVGADGRGVRAGTLDHTLPVRSAQVSPAGDRVVTVGEDGQARVWDVATAKAVSTFREVESIRAIAVVPDPEPPAAPTGMPTVQPPDRVVTAGGSTVRVWSPSDGRQLLKLTHDGPVRSMAVSPDGRRLACSVDDRAVVLWDGKSGQRLGQIDNPGRVGAIGLNRTGTQVFAVSDDKTVRIWDVNPPDRRPPGAVDFDSDDKPVRIRDVNPARLVAALDHPEPVESVEFHYDRASVLTASGSVARLWELQTKRPIEFRHEGRLAAVGFGDPRQGWLVTVTSAGRLTIWDAAAGKELQSRDVGPVAKASRVAPIVVGEGGFGVASTVGTIDDAGAVKFWPFITPNWKIPPHALPPHGRVRMLHLDPLSMRALTVTDDNTLRSWLPHKIGDVTKEHFSIPGVDPAILETSRDGSLIVAAPKDGPAQAWHEAGGKPMATLFHGPAVQAAEFSPDGGRVVTCDDDQTARVWDAATGARRLALAHPGVVRSAPFSPDGRRIATTCDDRKVRVWDAQTGERLQELRHGGQIRSLVFSPDGSRLATTYPDGTITLWDPVTGEPIAVLADHLVPLLAIRFAAGGDRLIGVGENRVVYTWRTADDRPADGKK